MDILLVADQSHGPDALQTRLCNHRNVTFFSSLSAPEEAMVQLALKGCAKAVDLVLFDLALPGLDPLATLSHLAANDVETKVGFIGRQIPMELLQQLVRRGAACVLEHDANAAEITQVLATLQRADQHLPDVYRRSLAGHINDLPTQRLSDTQLAVLELLRSGTSVADIATQLRLPNSTVNGYIRTIYEVLQRSDAPECVAGAKDLGLSY